MLINSKSDLYPFALTISFGIIEAAASSHPIRAPTISSAGCVGWFFESVIGRIIGSGCRIEKRRRGAWVDNHI